MSERMVKIKGGNGAPFLISGHKSEGIYNIILINGVQNKRLLPTNQVRGFNDKSSNDTTLLSLQGASAMKQSRF